MQKQYLINEIYYTLHGEGVRYGIPHVFIRFAKCNLTCKFCDTEFESYRAMSAVEILEEATRLADEATPLDTQQTVSGQIRGGKPLPHQPCRWLMLCGGEPLMQVDQSFVDAALLMGWSMALETNGTLPAPEGITWITCSPKVAEHAIKLQIANELKYVRGYGQGIPHPKIEADHYLISPMFDGDNIDPKTMAWVVDLVRRNPQWRLTVQHHKAGFGGLR